MAKLTHIDAGGDARMVDVGEKQVTAREAVAEGFIEVSPEALAAVTERRAAKGDVLMVAQIAGIQAAKRTSDLIPLCHPLALSAVEVHLEVSDGGVSCRAVVRTTGQTGVEMEALTAVSVALLTVYDMLKAVDKGMVLREVVLVEKRGGRGGEWRRVAR